MSRCNHCGPVSGKVHHVRLYINYGTFRDYSTGTYCIPCLKRMQEPNGYGRNSQVMDIMKLEYMTKEDWEEN